MAKNTKSALPHKPADFTLYVQGDSVYSVPPSKVFGPGERRVSFDNASDEALAIAFPQPKLGAKPKGFLLKAGSRKSISIKGAYQGVFHSLRAIIKDLCPTCGTHLAGKSKAKRYYSGWPDVPMVANVARDAGGDYEGDPVIIIRP